MANIRSSTCEDAEKIVDLLNLVWGTWPKMDLDYSPVDHFKWKFFENPINIQVMVCAEENGEIIGTGNSMMKKIKLDDRVYLSSTGSDAAVHPDHRKIGVFGEMRKKLNYLLNENRVHLHNSATTNKVLINYSKKQGYKSFPHKTFEMIRIENPIKHLRYAESTGPGIPVISSNVMDRVKNIVSRPKTHPSYVIRKTEAFDSEIDKFWDNVKEHYGFIVERSKDYLNWRYCNPKGGTYSIFLLYEEKQIIGYSILRINHFFKAYPTGYIVDLITIPEKKDAQELLVANALQYFNLNNINIVKVWCLEGHPIESILEKYSFTKSELISIVFQGNMILDDEYDFLKSCPCDQIHFAFGDHDWI